ncbi:MAG: hypothetical protein WCD31_00465 [Gillisia sp.]
MKNKLLFISVFFLFYTSVFSQAIDEFRVFYGTADSRFLDNPQLIGGGINDVKNFNKIGFKLLKYLDRYEKIGLDVGLTFSRADVLITSNFSGSPVNKRKESFEMLSIPLNLNITILRHIFANAGPVFDFQTSNNSFVSQSGVGYMLGVGGKYYFNNVLVFLNPNFQRHTVTPFNTKSDPKKLTEFGFIIGVGLYL